MKIEDIKSVASIGCGTIGYSFAIKFAMAGYKVYAYNRSIETQKRVQERIQESLHSLVRYEIIEKDDIQAIYQRFQFTNSIKEAVSEVQFIQESTKEDYGVKQELIKEIEQYCSKECIIASSTSGLLITEIAKYAVHPERILGGHPYNPPHLVPLVEISKGKHTSEENVELAKSFYNYIGNEAVVLKKEALGFICNRLQMALYREVCNLVMNDVCTIEDADKALVFGPGIRWAIMGPSLLFELGGGDGGVSGLMRHLNSSYTLWLHDMADWKEFPEEWPEIAQKGVNEELKRRSSIEGNTRERLQEYRDSMLIKILRLHGKLKH